MTATTVESRLPANFARERFGLWLGQEYTIRHIGHLAGVDSMVVRRIASGAQDWIDPDLHDRVRRIWPTPANAPTAHTKVPAIGATRRLGALHRIGHTRHVLQPRLPGVNVGLVAAGRLTRINRSSWEAVRDLYDALSMTPGTSAISRLRAEKAGHATPLDWEGVDIDDPEARPLDVDVDSDWEEFEDNFWARVDRKPVGCWMWTGTISGTAPSWVTYKGRQMAPWQVAWMLAWGEDRPPRSATERTCGERMCVNPHHRTYLPS